MLQCEHRLAEAARPTPYAVTDLARSMSDIMMTDLTGPLSGVCAVAGIEFLF